MRKISLFLIATAGLAVTGCANSGASYQPIIDGPASENYSVDLDSCQQLATERKYVNASTKTNAAIGAGLGALAGMADNDVSDAEGAIAGAVVGAVVGGGAGMAQTREQRRQIVIECMKGRGHPVVG